MYNMCSYTQYHRKSNTSIDQNPENEQSEKMYKSVFCASNYKNYVCSVSDFLSLLVLRINIYNIDHFKSFFLPNWKE